MLQEMRKYTKSWLGVSIIGIPVVISFVIWGIADIFRGSTDTSVATVGGEPIPIESFQRDYRNLTRQASRLGAIKPAQAKAYANQTLNDLIDQTAIDSYLRHYGLVVSDQEVSSRIRAIPAFAGPLGTFDHQRFTQLLVQAGFENEQSFVDLIRSQLTRSQFLSATADGLQLPAGYARALFNYLNEVRAAEYITLPASAAGPAPTPTDSDLQSYIAANKSRFSTPEYRTVTFAWLSPNDLMGSVKVTDDQLKQQYEAQKSQYVIPEKREVEQLVFPTEAAAKSARAKIDSGTSFEDLIKQQGKTAADASLGTVVKEDLAERGAAVFALQEGGVTQPIKAPVGYALLHVVNITPGSSKSFDDVKEDLRKQIAGQLAGAKIADLGNAYIDESSRGRTLAQAAAKVGMHVSHIASIDATGHLPDGTKAQIPDDPELLQQMFKADVGDEGDPFIAKSGTTFVVKVEGIRPPELKPLNTVRAEATQSWQKQEIARRLEAKARELAASATSEKSLASIAAQTGATVLKTGAIRRPLVDQPIEGPLPAPVLAKVFSVPAGDAVYGPTADGSSFIIARVTGVSHPPPGVVSEMRMKQFATQVGGQAGADVAQTVAAAARDKQGVTINQKNVDRFSGEEGG